MDEKIIVFCVGTDGHPCSLDYKKHNWETYKKDSYSNSFDWCTSALGHIGSPCVFCEQEVGKKWKRVTAAR